MANVCIKVCKLMYQIPIRVLCSVLVIFQGCILDYYLVHYKNVYWYFWVIADIAVLFVFVMAFVISYRNLLLAKNSALGNTPTQTASPPLGIFAWLTYSCLLAARVAIIFKDFAWQLNEDYIFGQNTLKINISLAAFVFMLLLLSHHDAELNSERKQVITELTGTVVLDVLDSVDVLDILFNHEDIEDFPIFLDTAIIAIACINLILPTLPLITLSQTHFGHKKVPKGFLLLHKMLLVFLVNLPLLIIRLILWHLLSKEISIFPVKNVIVMFIIFHELYEKRREDKMQEEIEMNEVEEEGTYLRRDSETRDCEG